MTHSHNLLDEKLAWNKSVNIKVWRLYIFVILAGVAVLQFTHSHGVGTQGSPSFFGIISSDKEENAFTKFAGKEKYG